MRAIDRVKIPYVEVSRLITIYDHLKREEKFYHLYRRLIVPLLRACVSSKSCIYVWPWMRTTRITARQRKKSHRYPSPLYYLQSFSPFTERRSASAGPIFRRPHLSRLVAGKIRQWPATSRRVATKNWENRSPNTRFARIPLKVITIKCEQFNRDDRCG